MKAKTNLDSETLADFATVADIPEHFQLVSNSQDIHATLESIGKLDQLDDCGCLFVEVGEGEYLSVYECTHSVPLLTYPVYRLL